MENIHQVFEEMGNWKTDFQSKSFSKRILIIDDEPAVAEEMARYLRQEGYTVDIVGSAELGLQSFVMKTYHLVLIDVFLPGRSTVKLIQLLKDTCIQCVLVLLIGPAPLQVPSEVLQFSLIPCLSKPVTPYVLRRRVHDLLYRKEREPQSRLLSAERSQGALLEGLRSRSQKMRDIFDRVRMIAQTNATIFITGEVGTGKNSLARVIHNQSKRKQGPFLSIKTQMMPKDRIFLEIFGSDDRGYFSESPNRSRLGVGLGGTIYLDDFGEIDERSVQRFQKIFDGTGEQGKQYRQLRGFDVRMIFASVHSMCPASTEQKLHAECLEKLKPLEIHIPPLRERPEDIVPLAYEFVSSFSIQYRKLVGIIPVETRKILESYHWPGNISELRHVIEQAVFLSKGPVLSPDLLPYHIFHASTGAEVISIPIGWSLEKAEKEIIGRTLEAHHKNKKGTAKTLGISRRSLYNKLAIYFEEYTKEEEEEEEEEEEQNLTRSTPNR